ncbi:hypothetical protein Tco_0328958 [Tanacetum coccineum]
MTLMLCNKLSVKKGSTREVRPVWNNAHGVHHQNKLTHPHPKRNFVPIVVATKSGLVPVNAAKQSSPRAAASISIARHVNIVALKQKVNATSPIKYSYFKAHSPLRRSFNQKSAAKTNNFNKKVYTAKVNNVTTAGPEVVVSTAEGKRENVVKSLACWIWRPTGKAIDHISKDRGSYMLKIFDYVDPQGRLNPKGGKITRKGKIRIGKLDFEDVYFVKELKFNLFSVSQMCDKKNSFLFTETECLVLSPDFKLLDEKPVMVVEDDEMSKEKEIDKLMALISLSFKKIYKPTNNNLRTSSNTSRANQDNTPRINRGIGYDNQRAVNVVGARENVEQADWRDDTDDEPEDQELKAHYLYMAQIQKVTPDAADNSGPIFDDEPLQNVQNDNDNYNVFANDSEHPEQPESINDTYLKEHGDTNITTDLLDMSNNGGEVDQDEDENEDLAKERNLLASLIEKLKCEIDENKYRNKLLESSNKTLVDKLKSEIEDFKNKNKCLESSNNQFKEANIELAKNNQLMFKDLKKF